MSLLPYLFESELIPHHHHQRRRLPFQHFALALHPEDMLAEVAAPLALLSPDYYRPWRQMATVAKDLGSTVSSDRDKVEFNLDVQQFKPEEITVKTTDGYVVVEGKHEEKKDGGGYVSRQFCRRYALPKDCPVERVESRLSSDGVLTVVAPRSAPAVTDQRNVSIEHTGPVREQSEQEKKEDKMDQ